MKKFSYIKIILVLSIQQIFGQVTITTGPEWKDALLLRSLLPSEASMQTTNYNNYPRIAATAWTHSGSQITYRSLMQFDLSSILPGSTVQSATLYLYSDPAYTSGELSNQSLSGANSVYFQKVTQAWDASTVTWNTQPTTTTTNRVWAGASTSTIGNITVNLTTLVQDMGMIQALPKQPNLRRNFSDRLKSTIEGIFFEAQPKEPF